MWHKGMNHEQSILSEPDLALEVESQADGLIVSHDTFLWTVHLDGWGTGKPGHVEAGTRWR